MPNLPQHGPMICPPKGLVSTFHPKDGIGVHGSAFHPRIVDDINFDEVCARFVSYRERTIESEIIQCVLTNNHNLHDDDDEKLFSSNSISRLSCVSAHGRQHTESKKSPTGPPRMS